MGELHLIIGCMFSGKSSTLLSIIRRYKVLEKNILCINHASDKRYGTDKIISHDNRSEVCSQLSSLNDVSDTDYTTSEVIIIEEAHFFNDLVEFVNRCLEDDKKVYVAGLNGDFERKPIGFINELIPLCDTIKKLDALCLMCKDGTKAIFTKRIVDSKDQYLVGSTEMYMPVCRRHYK